MSRLEKILKILLSTLLFLLPWQTIWIYQETFLNESKLEYGTLGFYGTEVLLWICVVLFMAWFWKKREGGWGKWEEFKFTKDRIFVLSCLLLIVYCLFSVLWSVDKNIAFQHSLHVMGAFLFFFMLMIGSLNFKQIAKWFIAGAVCTSVLGIWQFLSQSTFAFKWLGIIHHPVWESGTSVIVGENIGRWLRAYGGFQHPNVFGGYLVVALLFVLFLKSKVSGQWSKVFLFISYILNLTALFFTFSRSAWLAFAIFLSLYFFISLFQKRLSFIIYHLLLTFVISIILTATFFPLVQTRILGDSSHEIASISERVDLNSEAIEIFKQNKWVGVGVGNYTFAAYELNPEREGWQYQPVHNVFLLVLAELGIVGVILLLTVIYSFYRYQKADSRYHGQLYLLFFICYLVISSFDHYPYSSYLGLMLFAVFFASLLKLETNY